MWWIIAIIIVIIIINQVSAYNERQREERRARYNKYNNTDTTSKTPKNPLYSMDIDELFDEYKKESDIPPLDSLVRWAYEKGEITSGKTSFQNLNEEDKKTILRIAINIWNKRKKDKKNAEEIERKYYTHDHRS